jgi:DNA (cytosine-5)-methyltransferase 1
MSESNYSGIDLFAGVGGLSLGLSQSGIDMQIAIESNSIAALNLEKNFKNMMIILSDIHDINQGKIINNKILKKRNIDIVAGGPPCQGFSKSNLRTRNMSNPINYLYKEYFKFVKYINPELFLLENVEGLMTLNDGNFLKDILELGSILGYNIQWSVVNSENFGIPQRRRRILIIGTKNKNNRSFFQYDGPYNITVRVRV